MRASRRATAYRAALQSGPGAQDGQGETGDRGNWACSSLEKRRLRGVSKCNPQLPNGDYNGDGDSLF